MTDKDIDTALRNLDKRVRIECTDGEVIVGKIELVSTEEQEIVIDLVSTTRASRYEKFDIQPSYLLHFEEIASVRSVDADQ